MFLLIAIPFALIVLAVPVFVVVRLRTHFRDQKITEELRTLATKLGMNFLAEEKLPPEVENGNFPLFSQFHRDPKNVMTGNSNDANIKVFEFIERLPKNRFMIQTVAMFESSAVFPNFSMAPENLFDRTLKLFGYQDINFSFAPQFSSSYLLQSDDEARLRGAFTPEVLTYFSKHNEYSVEADKNKLLIYTRGKRIPPEELPSFITETRKVFELFRNGAGSR